MPVSLGRKLRGQAERLGYATLERTIGIRQYIPGREPLVPSFLIVGAQRSGTTSLQKYLQQHPGFVAPVRKEVHYFDRHYARGLDWYLSHFPQHRDGAISGDATPYYLYHPLAAGRAGQQLPNAKIVVLLRDPAERARSHYQHEVAKGCEDLSLEAALDAEPSRLEGEVERLISDGTYQSYAHQHHSYVSRGRYLEQLLRWEAVYGRDQVLVLTSEDLFADPQSTLATLLEFLGLEPFALRDAKIHNSYVKRPISDAVFDRLTRELHDDNVRLYDHLGRDLGWRSPGR